MTIKISHLLRALLRSNRVLLDHYFFLGNYSFLSRFLKGSGSLSGSGGIINLGSAKRYFLVSSFLLFAPLAPFMIIIY